MPASTKSFHGLEDDYAFFEASVTEREGTLRAWEPWLSKLRRRSGPLRILDFGCGTGSFTIDVLNLLGRRSEDLFLTFVEPDERSGGAAQERFRIKDFGGLVRWDNGLEFGDQKFDLVFSHHVLYYVPDLRPVLLELKRTLAEDGLILVVVGDDESGPGRLQNQVLGQAGLRSPYRSGIEVQRQFFEVFPDAGVAPFQTELKMEDTLENRESIMRFLVGEFGKRVSWEYALSVFDAFSDGSRITVPSEELNLFLDRTRAVS
jgi:SAM-dependent methyltransferase